LYFVLLLAYECGGRYGWDVTMQGKQAKILGSAPQGMLLFRERVVADEERRADE